MDIYDNKPVIGIEDNPDFVEEILVRGAAHVAFKAFEVEEPEAWMTAAESSYDKLVEAFRKHGMMHDDEYATVTLDLDLDSFEELLQHHRTETPDLLEKHGTLFQTLCESVDALRMREM
jgi:hypothetical protein